MAALTTTSVRAVSAVSARKANFAGSRASFAAPAKAPVSARASLKVQAANRELWCVSPPRTRDPPVPISDAGVSFDEFLIRSRRVRRVRRIARLEPRVNPSSGTHGET